jgi:predicted dehydrogenase
LGIGIMGSDHARWLASGQIRGATLTAVADPDPTRLAWANDNLGPEVQRFDRPADLLESGVADAVIVATPHFLHPVLSKSALEHGLHVLCEKPIAVYTKAARELEPLARSKGLVFALMYNQRTSPLYQKVRSLVMSGELGAVKRTSWTVTHWYRPQSYYDLSAWRATWSGEGGGVLMNQSPHQLDLWQWTVNMMPTRVRAFMSLGKYHQIEVEDDVTAYVEYPNGATGTFITSTGEAPGTNRLEIAGDRGKIVVEDGALHYWRLVTSERDFNRTYRGGHGAPEAWRVEVPIRGKETGHRGIIQNWVEAITKGVDLVAPAQEGLLGLSLSNAMHLSFWTDKWVDLPLDEDAFEQQLRHRMRQSKGPSWGV